MEQYVSSLNWFDITLLVIVFISTIFAMFRGFIKVVFSLITWLSSGFLALKAFPYSMEYFATKIHSETAAKAAAFAAVFLFAFIVLATINSRIVHALRKQCGGFFDRTLGLAFGAIRGGLIVCLIFFSISATSKTLHIGNNQERPGPNWFSKSGTYEVLDMVTTRMVAFAPEDMPVKLEQTVNKVKDITMATVGDELESSPNSTKTLNAQQKQLMKQVISGLPQERLADIYKRYDGNTSSLSEFEKVEIFSEILSMYKGYEKEGKIEAGKAVAADKVKELEDVLSASKQALPQGSQSNTDEGELGYKDRNIKQIDRLVEGVEKQ